MTEGETKPKMRPTGKMGTSHRVYTVGMVRLLLGCLELDGSDARALLGNTGGTAFTGSLWVQRSGGIFTGGADEHTLFLTRRASIWSESTLVRVFSALALWMYSIRTRLFLKTLPFDFW